MIGYKAIGAGLAMTLAVAGCADRLPEQEAAAARDVNVYRSPEGSSEPVGKLAIGQTVRVNCYRDNGTPSMSFVGFGYDGATGYAYARRRGNEISTSNFAPAIEPEGFRPCKPGADYAIEASGPFMTRRQ